MATFPVTVDTNYTSLAGVANDDIVQVSQGARFTVNTDTVNLRTVECLTLGEIRIENNSTTVPIFINMGHALQSGALRARAGGELNILGQWITIGTGDGTASQQFSLPTSAGSQQYSRLGGVWVSDRWWPCVLSLADFDSDETGEVCVHNLSLNRVEFGDGTAGKILPNGAVVSVPNIQVRWNDAPTTARIIDLDVSATGTAYLRQVALDGYVGATSTGTFHSNASQWDWDRVCFDLGGSGNTNLRWAWNNPDTDSSMTDVCFSRMSGTTREFQFLSVAAKFSLTRVTYITLVNTSPLISGNSTELIDCKVMFAGTTLTAGISLSAPQAYVKDIKWLARGTLTVSGAQSTIDGIKVTHRVTRTFAGQGSGPTVTMSGQGSTLTGMTDWKLTNRWLSPSNNNSLINMSGLNCQAFNIFDVGWYFGTQNRLFMITGRGGSLYDVHVLANAPRGNVWSSVPQVLTRNIFTTDSSIITDGNGAVTLMNDADLELHMTNYRVVATRILNGISTASQFRYVTLTTNGIGSDISDVLMLRNDVGRTAGMLIVIFGQEKTREWFEADPANTGRVLFTNDGKVFIENSGDRFTITGRIHFGLTGWDDILMDGVNPLNFSVEVRAKEGNGTFGDWYAHTTANLTTATAGFTNMRDNGVTLQYRITHNVSNLTDNLNCIETRCVVDATYVRSYTVRDVISSGGYSLHRRLDMARCNIAGTLRFAEAGTYTITDSEIGSVTNDSAGTVTINPIGSTVIGTNLGPNITINVAATALTITGFAAGSDIVIYDADAPATGDGSNVLQTFDEVGVSSVAYVYTYSAGLNIRVGVFKVGFVPLVSPVITLEPTSATLPITQQEDRNYVA